MPISMPVDMKGFKMIYNDRVYNVLHIMIDFETCKEGDESPQPKFIEAIYLNEDGEVKTVRDEAWCFQFVRKI